MKYITGLVAFGIPCEEDSCGTWQLPKSDFVNIELKESSDSILKDAMIETNKIIPYHEDTELYNVATHTRAYLDMLFNHQFKDLRNVFYDYMKSVKCREVIFMHVHKYGMKLDDAKAIYDFMSKEFGNAWVSYCQSTIGGVK